LQAAKMRFLHQQTCTKEVKGECQNKWEEPNINSRPAIKLSPWQYPRTGLRSEYLNACFNATNIQMIASATITVTKLVPETSAPAQWRKLDARHNCSARITWITSAWMKSRRSPRTFDAGRDEFLRDWCN
jgi:hypothetical protein